MLSGGILGLSALCRAEDITWRFFRVVAITVSVVLGMVLGMLLRDATWNVGVETVAVALLAVASAAGLIFVVVTATEPNYRAGCIRPLTAIGALAALAAAGMLGFLSDLWPATGTFEHVLALGGMVISAMVLGSVTLATLLGHAYLTATKMTIAPLRRLAGLFAAAVALRFLWVVVAGGGTAWSMWNAGDAGAGELRRQGLMILIRLSVGLLLPAVFAYMIWETVRLRATQSATGILYFTLVLVFIGELTGLYLVRETGIPF
jgi:hypothetical protein